MTQLGTVIKMWQS